MASNNMKPSVAQGMDDAGVEALLYLALLRDGRLIPRTPEEVALVVEQMVGQPVQLPPELLDPEAVLTGVMIPRSLPAPSAVNPDIIHQLACAARNGGDIPSEVRQQMERDRDEAERS